MRTPRNRRGRGPDTQGRILGDNAGKVPPAARAGSTLQRLHKRGLGRSWESRTGLTRVCRSHDRGVMSSQEAVHVCLMELTPTSGKGRWVLGGSIFGAVVGHRADRSRTYEMGLSCEQTIPGGGVCASALEPRGE